VARTTTDTLRNKTMITTVQQDVSSHTYALPTLSANDTVVTTGTTQTLVNKTLTAPVLQDNSSHTYLFPTVTSNDTVVTTGATQTLVNKTLNNPSFTSGAISGLVSVTSTTFNGNLNGNVLDNTQTHTLAPPTLSANDTLVGLTATQTLTNKTLTSPTITGTGTITASTLSNGNGSLGGFHTITPVYSNLQSWSTTATTYGPITGVPASAVAVLITFGGLTSTSGMYLLAAASGSLNTSDFHQNQVAQFCYNSATNSWSGIVLLNGSGKFDIGCNTGTVSYAWIYVYGYFG
jgi:hypothetical protein